MKIVILKYGSGGEIKAAAFHYVSEIKGVSGFK